VADDEMTPRVDPDDGGTATQGRPAGP